MSRSRNFCFTWNNYPADALQQLERIQCRYFIAGREVGESGTPHLQGVICFTQQKTLSAAIKALGIPQVHVEVTRSLDDAIEYCKKEGDFTEVGVRPASQAEKGQGEKLRWAAALASAKAGRFDEIDPRIQVTQCRNLEFIRNRELSSRTLVDANRRMLWLHGKTGTGKSFNARRTFVPHYLKTANTKWWDGYENQPYVIMDDIDKEHHFMGFHLKIWLDVYPFRAEVKGGSRMARPQLVIVTSNYTPEQIWSDAGTLEPLMRRLTLVSFDTETGTQPLLDVYRLPAELVDPSQEEETPAGPESGSASSGSQAAEVWGDEDGFVDQDAEWFSSLEEDEEGEWII